MREWKKQAHVTGHCLYHIVFIPKYRKKAIFGRLRQEIGQVFHELPIVIAGGKKLPENEALAMCAKAIGEGARGVDMGRNIFQAESPAAMCKAVSKIVHERFGAAEAYEFYCDLLRV